MVSSGLFLLCLIAIVSVTAFPNVEKTEVDTSHVDFSGRVPVVVALVKDSQGKEHEFKAAYWDAEEGPLPSEMKMFADDVITQVIKPGKDIIDAALIKGRNKYLLSPMLASIGFKFFFMAMGFNKRSKELEKRYHRANDDKFQQDSMKLLPDLVLKAQSELKEADKSAKKSGKGNKSAENKKYEDKEARKETGKRILLILDGIKQLVLNSPIGTHLDYKGITVDGQLMIEEAVEYIKFMSKSGLGWIVDLVANQCKNIAAEQKKQAALEGSEAEVN